MAGRPSSKGWLRSSTNALEEAGVPPALDLVEAAALYQTLYWVARTAAVPTPETDVLHVTAAGWSAIPALVHKALYGTPMILTEHGVFVRESYLAAVRSRDSAGARFVATRLARGLARAAYAGANVVSPSPTPTCSGRRASASIRTRSWFSTTDFAHHPSRRLRLVRRPWSRSVGSIRSRTSTPCSGWPRRRSGASPHARFLHYGPVTRGEEAYGRSCLLLHEQLGLGDRFRFMGRTTDPHGVVRDADVVLMTSISEGLPMSILEAMGQGRPVVATGVGGVPDVVKGCGVTTPPGEVHGLALGITTLLNAPELAWQLGRRGHRRLQRTFNEVACVESYRGLLHAVAAPAVLPRMTPPIVAEQLAAAA